MNDENHNITCTLHRVQYYKRGELISCSMHAEQIRFIIVSLLFSYSKQLRQIYRFKLNWDFLRDLQLHSSVKDKWEFVCIHEIFQRKELFEENACLCRKILRSLGLAIQPFTAKLLNIFASS